MLHLRTTEIEICILRASGMEKKPYATPKESSDSTVLLTSSRNPSAFHIRKIWSIPASISSDRTSIGHTQHGRNMKLTRNPHTHKFTDRHIHTHLHTFEASDGASCYLRTTGLGLAYAEHAASQSSIQASSCNSNSPIRTTMRRKSVCDPPQPPPRSPGPIRMGYRH